MRTTVIAILALVFGVDVRGAEIHQVARYRSGAKAGTEIVAVHAASRRAFLSNSDDGWVDVLDLSRPESPRRVARHAVPLARGESLTSVAVHPEGAYFAAVIESGDPTARGRVEFRAAADGALLGTVAVGVGPDAGVFAPDGRWLLVADEAEEFVFDRALKRFSSPAGTVTRIDLAAGPASASTTTIALPDLTGVEGVVGVAHGRKLERQVDVNGDGRITAPADLNGDGDFDDERVSVGAFGGQAIVADEQGGETFLLPIVGATPELLEPEYIAFSPDGARAFVTLQESDAIVVINVARAAVTLGFGLGVTEHAADLIDDDLARFDGRLRALREPDGLALTPDGRFILTADEGDTEPKLSQLEAGAVVGGGRTLSVFDATTGRLVGDTGTQIDQAAAAAGFYPDSRSAAKGSEPESVVAFVLGGVVHAAVGLERANGVALVSLADPAQPRVVAAACADRTAKAGAVAPEGLAHLEVAGRHYILAANEKDGSLSVYAISP